MKKMTQTGPAVFVRTILALLFLMLTTTPATAQSRPLTGSGTIITKTYPFNNFDKIHLENLNGLAEVEVGRPFSVSVAIDDNLLPLLSAGVNNGVLNIGLTGNERNKLYIENTGIRIKIALPEISVLEHTGNSQLTVNGIVGRYFRIKNTGNGNVQLKGSIDELDIIKTGNGDVQARNLPAQLVKITATGNGDVAINTPNPFEATLNGNGDVTNYGTGKSRNASMNGNGKIFYEPGMQQASVAISELTGLAGQWTGQLSYLDYTSNTQETIPCNLEAEIWAADNKIKLNFIYPREMKYNSSSVYALNTAGNRLGDASIIEKTTLAGGGIQIVTEQKGYDNNKPATIQQAIVLTEKTFTITKNVRYEGETQFFKRNEYRWNR